MKSVPIAALALSLMATSAMAQGRHWQGQEQGNNQPQQAPRAEQARPQQQPQQQRPQAQVQPQAREAPRAQFQRGEGRWAREGQAPVAQPAPQVVVPQGRDVGERRQFNGRQWQGQRPDQPQAVPQAQGAWQGQRQRQFQGDPRQRDDRQGGRQQYQPQQQAPGQPDNRGYGRDNRQDNRQGGADARRGDPNGWTRDGGRGGWDQNHRGPQVRPNWARPDGRGARDRNRPRYDSNRYPHFFAAQHRFRAPFYAFPFGYYDYDWGYGDYLPWGWYGPNYWIDDYYDYDLPIPPVGCEWVRVGRDALLIDTFDGRVLSVARLLFW